MGLTVKEVNRLLARGEPGRHLDGDGLYLEIDSPTAAHWLRRYQFAGRERWLGLGSARRFGLVEVREHNRKVSYQLLDGFDPLAQKHARKEKEREVGKNEIVAKGIMTFGQAAEDYYRLNAPGWASDKHRAQWSASVLGRSPSGEASGQGDHCKGLRSLLLKDITPGALAKVLHPIWTAKPATAKRVRQRIEKVFDYALAMQLIPGPANPANLGILQHILPRAASIETKNYAAVPYAEVPAMMRLLRKVEGSAARALQFLILTAARAKEATSASWSEIDLDSRIWTLPPKRMKGRKQHRVPLSGAAVDVLNRVWREDGNPFVFVGRHKGNSIGDNSAMLKLMKDLDRSETVHGLRSSFKEWATVNGYADELSEKALAHEVGSAVRRAYQRDDLVEMRRDMMEAWGRYCTLPPAGDNVVSMGTHR